MLYDFIKDDELKKELLLSVLKLNTPDRTKCDIEDAKKQLLKYGYSYDYLNKIYNRGSDNELFL